MAHPLSPFPDVPIIGRRRLPFDIGGVMPIISVRCNCTTEAPPLLMVAGFDGSASCPNCQRIYFINTMSFARETGKLGLNLGIDMTVHNARQAAAGNGSSVVKP